MSTVQNNGPRIANVATSRNNTYYPISGLLDELDMMDKQERLQFTSFLKEYLSWDEDTKQGYTRKERIALPDSHMPCYATQFLDNATIEPEVRLAESQKSIVGPFYFPQLPLDDGPMFSPHLKRWSYAQHRDGIIEVVGAIMVTQKRNLRDGVQQPRVKRKRTGQPPLIRRKQRPTSRRQRTRSTPLSDDVSDSYSNFSQSSRNTSTASPQEERFQRRASGSVSRPSTCSSTINTSRQSSTLSSDPITQKRAASSESSPSPSPVPSTVTRPTSSQSSAQTVQPTVDKQPNSSSAVSTPTRRPTTTPETEHANHFQTQNFHLNPTSPAVPILSPANTNEAETMRLKAKIEGMQHARKLCMETHCSQQIAARSVDGPAKQHLIAKSDGVLDMLMGLDQALEVDQASLRRLLGSNVVIQNGD